MEGDTVLRPYLPGDTRPSVITQLANAPVTEAREDQGGPGLFRSFLMRGFEGSSHCRINGRQLDLLAAARLDEHAVTDHWMLCDVIGGATVPFGQGSYHPLRLLLVDVYTLYGRPLLLMETGAEAGHGPGWLGYVIGEVHAARHAGVLIEGVCPYPVMVCPSWNDDRHCRCCLIRADWGWRSRAVDTELRDQLAEEAALLPAARSGKLL